MGKPLPEPVSEEEGTGIQQADRDRFYELLVTQVIYRPEIQDCAPDWSLGQGDICTQSL